MAAARKPATAGTRVLVIEHVDGRRRKLSVPSSAKVTYGPLFPGGKNNYGGDGNYLRVYEGTKQTVCMGGIKSFIDQSYQLEVERLETVEEELLVDGRTKFKSRQVSAGFEVVES